MIYDCFPFFNELDILEIRLETLYPHVDKFVLVESNQTFTLKHSPKEFTFEKNKARFSRFLDKVIHVKLENEFIPGSPWRNEYLQRDAILRGLKDSSDNDVIIMSDVDEIPAPEALGWGVEIAKDNNVVAFKQAMYRYFLNIRCTHELWAGTRMATVNTLKNKFGGSCEKMRHYQDAYIPAGWHFTGMSGVEKFIYKMQSFSHADICDTPQYTDVENMKKLFKQRVIKEGKDIHHFNNATYKIEENWRDTLPKCVDNEKYSHLIYSGEWK